MKHIKKPVIILLVVAVLFSVLLTACSGDTSVYSDGVLRTNAENAAKERIKTELSNNYKKFKIAKEKEDLVIDTVTNEGKDWFVSGTVTVVNKSDEADVQTADFSLSLELIDYVGQPTPTFKLIDFEMGEIVLPAE